MSLSSPQSDPRQKLLKKGLKYHREGNLGAAEASYRKLLKLDPTSAEARELRRVLDAKVDAVQAPLSALSANLTDDERALARRANAHLAQGKVHLAIDCLRRITELTPDSAAAHQHLGGAQERGGDLQGAAKSFQRAIALDPDTPDLYCHLARVLCRSDSAAAAVELYQRALALDPQRYDIYNDLALVLTNLGSFAAALETFRRSLRINPNCAKTRAGLGYLFDRKGDLVSAAEAYRDAIKLDRELFPAYTDLGLVLCGLGEVTEALECFERLRRLQPGSAEAKANLGLLHLLQGDLAAGWVEYESRWEVGIDGDRKLPQRRWKGEPLAGEMILLHAEQGFGDTLQFVRYVSMVAERGGRVVLEVQPGLHRLLSRTKGAERVISRGEPLPQFAWQCPILSLPLAFGTELPSIPARVPYVSPEPALVEAWKARTASNARRIGLVWGGNPTQHGDRLRSIPLEHLLRLLKVPGTAFFSLQVGPWREQINQLPPDFRLLDLSAELHDFADTAAAVANLDLVITVETSVAHLAGAMGKPVWIMLNKGCAWRWLLDREDSPWYPTARLFRQTTIGDWRNVVNRVEQALHQG